MPYSVSGAVWAGIFAAIVLALILYPASVLMRWARLDVLFFLGSLFPVKRGLLIYPAGALAAVALSVLFALVHASLYQAFGIRTGIAEWGTLFGVVQWLVNGLLLGTASRLHPRVVDGRIPDPGLFALNYPTGSAAVFLALHILYGIFAGNFYHAFR